MSLTKDRVRYVIYALFLAELLFFTRQSSYFGPYASPVILYGTAVALSMCVLYYARGRQWHLAPTAAVALPARQWWHTTWARGLALATVVAAGGLNNTNLVKHEVRGFRPILEFADIIPALQAYARRWLVGAEIYTPLTWELGYFELPTYLPAMWFPFVIAERLGFDYRYMAWGIFLLGVAFYELLVWRLQKNAWQTALLALVPFLSFYAFISHVWAYVGITVEYMLLGYYALLVAGILLRWWPLQAVGLLLCLLSRYSLVFWAPLYLGLMFFYGSRRHALLIAGTVAVGIVALYIVPYLSHNWGLFMEVQRSYTDAAAYEWKHLNSEGMPIHLYNGLGFASFFYKYGHGSLYDRIGLLKTVHVGLLVSIVATAAVVYYRQHVPRTDYRVFVVVVLKVYLATFYAFLQVPYAYLVTLGVFMSVFLVLITAGLKIPMAEPEPTVVEGLN